MTPFRSNLLQRLTPLLRPTLTGAAVALAALALDAPVAPAHAQVRAGVHGIYKSQAFDGTAGAGVRAEVDLDMIWSGLTIAGTWERLFPDCSDCSSQELGAHVLLIPRGPLFVGFGAGRQQYDDGTGTAPPDDWTFHFAAGLRLPNLPVIEPYLEFRQEFASGSLNEQTFIAGLLVSPLGRRTAPARLRR